MNSGADFNVRWRSAARVRLEKKLIAGQSVSLVWRELAWLREHQEQTDRLPLDHEGLLIEVLDAKDGKFAARWLVHDMQFFIAHLGW